MGCGAVKPATVQCGGSVGSRDRRQASVIEDVPFGLMRSIDIALVEEPVMEGRGTAEMLSPMVVMLAMVILVILASMTY